MGISGRDGICKRDAGTLFWQCGTVTAAIPVPALNEPENLPYVSPPIPHWADEVLLPDGHFSDDNLHVAQRLISGAAGADVVKCTTS
jgi:hypothetical protein